MLLLQPRFSFTFGFEDCLTPHLEAILDGRNQIDLDQADQSPAWCRPWWEWATAGLHQRPAGLFLQRIGLPWTLVQLAPLPPGTGLFQTRARTQLGLLPLGMGLLRVRTRVKLGLPPYGQATADAIAAGPISPGTGLPRTRVRTQLGPLLELPWIMPTVQLGLFPS